MNILDGSFRGDNKILFHTIKVKRFMIENFFTGTLQPLNA